MENTIKFISDRQNYGWMSNFHRAPFEASGHTWPTVEHAFQAAKNYNQDPMCTKIREAKTPGEAKKLGRQVELRPDWEDTKVDVMHYLVLAKFCTHLDLARKLLDTGDALIEEDSKWDSFWGTGPKGTGRNEMGKILMNTRKVLREHPRMEDVFVAAGI